MQKHAYVNKKTPRNHIVLLMCTTHQKSLTSSINCRLSCKEDHIIQLNIFFTMQFNNDIIDQEKEGSLGNDEAMLIKCECCGMAEEFTPDYVSRVREFFFGRWICGLCSEAVKEKKRKRKITLEEALVWHMDICMTFRMKRRSYGNEAFSGWTHDERDCEDEFTVGE